MSELAAKELYIRQISIPGDIPADNYVAHIPVVRHLMCNTLELHKPVTILVGENGIGKSTLIEALAVTMRFNAEGGTKNFNFATKNVNYYEAPLPLICKKKLRLKFSVRKSLTLFRAQSAVARIETRGKQSTKDNF